MVLLVGCLGSNICTCLSIIKVIGSCLVFIRTLIGLVLLPCFDIIIALFYTVYNAVEIIIVIILTIAGFLIIILSTILGPFGNIFGYTMVVCIIVTWGCCQFTSLIIVYIIMFIRDRLNLNIYPLDQPSLLTIRNFYYGGMLFWNVYTSYLVACGVLESLFAIKGSTGWLLTTLTLGIGGAVWILWKYFEGAVFTAGAAIEGTVSVVLAICLELVFNIIGLIYAPLLWPIPELIGLLA